MTSNRVDLEYQVQKVLQVEHGGAGNTKGLPPGVGLIATNGSGSTIALGSLVRYISTANVREQNTIMAVATDAAVDVLGVVVGRIDNEGNVSYQSVPDQYDALVWRFGEVPVLLRDSVSAGQYAYSTTTAGKARGSASYAPGALGRFKMDGSAGSTGELELFGWPAIASLLPIYQGPALLTSGPTRLSLADELRGHASGGNVGVDIDTDRLFLEAQQVAVADTASHFDAPTPASGTETLRPTSDVASAGTITTNPGGHSTYYDLLDSTTPGSDYIQVGPSGSGTASYVIVGLAATALDDTKRIDSVEVHVYAALGALDGISQLYLRDPQTNALMDIGDIPTGVTGDYGVTLTTRPWDSQGWTLSDLAHLEAGFSGSATNGQPKLYQLYIEVNWTAPKTVESVLAQAGRRSEPAVDHGSMGAAETIGAAAGLWHRGTLDADCTLTMTGFAADAGTVLLFKVTQDGIGAHAVMQDPDVVFAGDDQPGQAAGEVTFFLYWSDEGDSTIYGAKVGATALTVYDEGIELTTAASALDFVGKGVTASGAGAQKTISIPGSLGADHEHVDNVLYSGDGATTDFELPVEPFDQFSVAAYVAGTRTAATLTGLMLTTLHFGSAPASGTDNIVVDIAARVA